MPAYGRAVRGRAIAWALILILAAVLAHSSALAAMDEASLIAAWEDAVIADPDTLVLEPLGDNRYHFETMRFPYEGGLRVINTSIDPSAGAYDYPMGVVEVELTDADQEFLKRYEMSYGHWKQLNYLFYDQDQDKWLTSWELDDMAYLSCDTPWYSIFLSGDLFWLLMLLLFVIFLIFALRKSSRQMKKAMSAQDQALADNQEVLELARRSTALQEESLAVLKAIAAKLER